MKKIILFSYLLLLQYCVYSQFNFQPIVTQMYSWGIVNDQIWQLTDAGIYVTDANSMNIVKHFYIVQKGEEYSMIKKDNFNRIWVGLNEDGIAMYDGTNWTVWNYQNTPLFEKKYGIISFGVEVDGTVWAIGSSRSSAGNFRTYFYKNGVWTFDTSQIFGKVYYPTFLLSPTGVFLAVTVDTILYKQNDSWIGVPEYNDKMYQSYENPVFDKDGNLWINNYNSQIFKYSSLSAKPELITQCPQRIFYLSIDNDNNLWCTADNDRIYIYSNNKWSNIPSLPNKSYASMPFSLLIGPDKVYVEQSLNFYEHLVTIFENLVPVSNHYLEYAQSRFFGQDEKGNLWFGSEANLMTRWNKPDGSFSYFELPKIPISEFQSYDKNFISGNGEDMLFVMNSGNLLYFNGFKWNIITLNGFKAMDAAIAKDNKIYVIAYDNNSQYFKKIYDLNIQLWSDLDLSLYGDLSLLKIQKGIDNLVWFVANEGLGRIAQDGTVTMYKIPSTFEINHYIDMDINEKGLVQFSNLSSSLGMPMEILWFDGQKEELIINPLSSDLVNEISSNFLLYDIFTLLDNSKQIWVAYVNDDLLTESELVVWNYNSGIWTRYGNFKIKNMYGVNGILKTLDNQILILCNNGIVTLGSNSTKSSDLNALNESKKLYIFPNPTSGKVIVDVRAFKNFVINIFDLQGKKLPAKMNRITDGYVEIDLKHCQNGIYKISLRENNRKVYAGQVILRK